jgi:hypothetical protein
MIITYAARWGTSVFGQTEFLIEDFEGKWIAKCGQVAWPSRSPDLN